MRQSQNLNFWLSISEYKEYIPKEDQFDLKQSGDNAGKASVTHVASPAEAFTEALTEAFKIIPAETFLNKEKSLYEKSCQKKREIK